MFLVATVSVARSIAESTGHLFARLYITTTSLTHKEIKTQHNIMLD